MDVSSFCRISDPLEFGLHDRSASSRCSAVSQTFTFIGDLPFLIDKVRASWSRVALVIFIPVACMWHSMSPDDATRDQRWDHFSVFDIFLSNDIPQHFLFSGNLYTGCAPRDFGVAASVPIVSVRYTFLGCRLCNIISNMYQ
ncbi:hypothetical protein NPIL_492811 [Nephila pilipes]|uniref:Uncharacterized protein n=1 Tax=Nephila pilipes TaxID=299642 RepID=A0A8X6NCA8_NEPPI|nr:hypothetical protein NPIL_492811 [Nephila pilipes]